MLLSLRLGGRVLELNAVPISDPRRWTDSRKTLEVTSRQFLCLASHPGTDKIEIGRRARTAIPQATKPVRNSLWSRRSPTVFTFSVGDCHGKHPPLTWTNLGERNLLENLKKRELAMSSSRQAVAW
jgi:hypothetical protein